MYVHYVDAGLYRHVQCLSRDIEKVKALRTLADFLSVDKKIIFTCRLVCSEFRQVCDKIGACWAISDSARSQNVLSDLVS